MGVNPYKSLHAAGAPGIAGWRCWLYRMLQCTSQGKTSLGTGKFCRNDKGISEQQPEARGTGPKPPQLLVIAIPDRAELHARIGTATLATPLAAGATLAEAIVAMPSTSTTLARTM